MENVIINDSICVLDLFATAEDGGGNIQRSFRLRQDYPHPAGYE